MVAIYGAVHLLVDFACAYLMFAGIYGTRDWYLCMLLYNFCAFAMQMPIGAAADGRNKNARLSAAGCLLIAASYLTCGVSGPASAVIAGLGNGMFHVGGGLDVLNVSSGQAGLLGVFVAPGALGLFAGTVLGKGADGLKDWPALILLGASAVMGLAAKRKDIWKNSQNVPVSYGGIQTKGAAAALACLAAVVILRSYLGMIQNFSWKDSLGAGALIVCATSFGKMAGGFLCDIFGMQRTAICSVALAGILYLFSGYPLAGILAVFFWNMTMPLTLWAGACILPGAKGFVFGLMTFCLFLGFCPAYLEISPLTDLFPSPEMGLALLCGISLIFFRRGIEAVKR